MLNVETIWLIIGFTGQALFAGRFLVQWIISEIKRTSVIPIGFWYLSIFGGIILLFYALHKADPVFIAGQSFGLIVYVRNLYFVKLEKNRGTAAT